MSFFLSLSPILLILILMVGFRWGASRSGGAGYLLALLLAIVYFGVNIELIAYAHMKALLLAFDVLYIVWAAYILYKVAEQAGAIQTIGELLPKLTADKTMQALIIGWVFASFLQGIGGFGVPVAVIAPIFISLGFSPLSAVVIPSIGHGWAVTYGSLGSSFNSLLATTGLDSSLLAGPSATFLGIAGLLSGFLIVHASGKWQQILKYLLPIILIGSAMGLAQYFTAMSGLWNIAAFSGAIAGLVVSAIYTILANRNNGQIEKIDWRRLVTAFSGYIILVLIILIVQFVPGVNAWLSQIRIQLAFPATTTALGFQTSAGTGRIIPLFTHAGAMLLYASVIGFLIFKHAGFYQPGAGKRILGDTFMKMTSSSISILSMVSLAVLMEHAGMTYDLAKGLSTGFQSLFPAIAPWIGAIGSFMTGSNTNSNVIFGLLQLQTAHLLNLPVAIILAGQTAGAALASLAAPTKIVVGASTAGMSGKEGQIMRALLGYTLILVVTISLLTVLGVLLAGG